ncbi:hypothetical protein SPRA44_760211 [Serratia proteamaculans]|nr:hypothetical protein SPRA44_760211 [Serratia proteamaculans]
MGKKAHGNGYMAEVFTNCVVIVYIAEFDFDTRLMAIDTIRYKTAVPPCHHPSIAASQLFDVH